MKLSMTLYAGVTIYHEQPEQIDVLQAFMGTTAKATLAQNEDNDELNFFMKDLFLNNFLLQNWKGVVDYDFASMVLSSQDGFRDWLSQLGPLATVQLNSIDVPEAIQCLGYNFNEFAYQPYSKYMEFSFSQAPTSFS